MRKLTVFNNVSLDGYFTDANESLSWVHLNPADAEWSAFVAGNAASGSMLLFGRVTYDMMVSYWPTPMAAENDPVVAERMNALPKVVFSRTITAPTWSNTHLVSDDIEAEVRRLKAAPGGDMTILGSGIIVAQLAQAGLIDEYQMVVNPVVLGAGRTMFAGLAQPVNLTLVEARSFGNGNVVLRYQPT